MNKRDILPLALFSAALLAPTTGIAYGLGDIRVESYLGQPFRATIPIQGSQGEEIDTDCLKLSPPALERDMVYLRRATLSVVSQNNTSQLVISGHFPLDEPYINVVIDLGCKEQGHLTREYTVLIDPPNYSYRPSPALPSGEIPASTTKAKSSAPGEISDIQPARSAKKKARSVLKKAKPTKIVKKRQDQLKVLSGSGEKPAQPGLSEKERLQLHEKELMKELDDKTARYLEMQAQLSKLESKLAEMQKTLEAQNKLLAAMQQAPAPEKLVSPGRKMDYWLAAPLLLAGGIAYFLARRSRKRSLDEWAPTTRELDLGNGRKLKPKNPF